jgi:Ras-related protein Rab-7A
MNRYHTGKFTGQYKATIGADFLSKEVVVEDRKSPGQHKVATLQIWDTAGQERFQSLGVAFYRGADACLLVYDVTDPHSLDNLNNWRSEFLRQVSSGLDGGANFPFVVLGNKIDKESERRVPRARAEEWCQNANAAPGSPAPSQPMTHFETSAKTAANVEEAFLVAASLALEQEERNRKNQPQLFVPPTETINLNRNSSAPKQGGCCS